MAIVDESAAQHDDRLNKNLERHMAASDRVIGQVAQLKLLNEGGGQLDEAIGALASLAATGNPT
jgi:hypothetical protein